MKEPEIRVVSESEYRKKLKAEIAEKGLKGAIKERCDNIADETRNVMTYAGWGYVIEQLNDILNLIESEGKQ